MTQGQIDLPGRLRAETRDLHDAAERHPLQAALAKGELPRELYVANLEQLLLVHRRLETAISGASQREPRLAALVDPALHQEQNLIADLTHLGGATSPEPTPATDRLLEEISRAASECPVALVGFHYVLEGSKNGGRYVAMGVRRAYGLTHLGVSYLDPHGEQQRSLWQGYRERLGALSVSPAEADRVVESAQRLFRAISEIGSDLTRGSEIAN